MKRFTILILALLTLVASACEGSSSTHNIVVGGTCNVYQDCPATGCPDGYNPSCYEQTCVCNRMEIINEPFCFKAIDCPEEEGYEAYCRDYTCYYEKTEVIEIPVEVPMACESASDCGTCPDSSQATCLDSGMCFCQETAQASQECYALVRGEFLEQFMQKYLGDGYDDYVASVDPYFPDVPTGHEYFKPVQAAVDFGLIDGYSDGTFRPYDHLNRAEASKLVVMAVDGLVGYTPPSQSSYYDTDPADWFFIYTQAATDYGWTRGYVNPDGSPTGLFGPSDVASSCFLDAMLARAEFTSPTPEISIELESISPMFRIAVAGSLTQMSASYRAYNTSETHRLDTLVVTNQPDGEGTPVVSNHALSMVYINCAPPSGDGAWTLNGALLINGIAQFTNLGCYDTTGDGLEFEVVYDVSTSETVGEYLSGQLFRLTLDDLRLKDSQEEIPVRVVRKTLLTFDVSAPFNPDLHNGKVVAYPFNVSAHPNGSGGLARLTFMADTYDANGNGFNMAQFRLYRGSTLMTVNIFDENGQSLDSALSPLETPKFIVTFPNEEVIQAGTTQQYFLKAMASGVGTNDSFSVRIDFGDEDTPVTELTSNVNANTGQLISNFPTVGLFPTLLQFLYGTPAAHSVIWSDGSADNHVYWIESEKSSFDFTNGYALGIAELPAVTLSAD